LAAKLWNGVPNLSRDFMKEIFLILWDERIGANNLEE
jgi:hypothetical protein